MTQEWDRTNRHDKIGAVAIEQWQRDRDVQAIVDEDAGVVEVSTNDGEAKRYGYFLMPGAGVQLRVIEQAAPDPDSTEQPARPDPLAPVVAHFSGGPGDC